MRTVTNDEFPHTRTILTRAQNEYLRCETAEDCRAVTAKVLLDLLLVVVDVALTQEPA